MTYAAVPLSVYNLNMRLHTNTLLKVTSKLLVMFHEKCLALEKRLATFLEEDQ